MNNINTNKNKNNNTNRILSSKRILSTKYKAILNRVIALTVVLAFALGMIAFPVNAEGEWDETIYRVYTSKEQLSQAEIDSLDESCCEFVETWKLDMVMMITDSEDYDGSLEDSTLAFYEHNGFGYGENHDGVVCCYDEDTKECSIVLVGAAKDKLPQSFVDENEEYIPTFFEKHSYFGVMYAFYLVTVDYMEENYGDGSKTLAEVAGSDDSSEDIQEEIQEDATEAADTETTDDETSDEESAATTGDASASTGSKSLGSDKSALPVDPGFDFTERNEFGLPIRDHDEDKPCWYTKELDSFKFYNDSYIPRVVDMADLFSDEEEEAIAEKIATVTAETGKDVAIYTDTSSYGMDWEKFCYDFYDMCGYGIGETRDGMLLYIDMDPGNRGWVADSVGVCEDMYTEEIANEMDDELYEYMADAKYADGVLMWIDCVNNLYTKGIPFAPEWLPEDTDSFVRTQNSEITRVYDDANLFNEGEETKLADEIRDISEKYGIDVVIHSTRRTYGMTDDDYSDAFYNYNGYGLGDKNDGILLTIVKDNENRTNVTAYGKGVDKLTKVNLNRLVDQTHAKISYDYYIEGAEIFLKNVEHMERTGRVNKTTAGWFWRIIIAAVAGWIVGGIALSIAKSKMATISGAYGADKYLTGQQKVIPVADTLISEHTTKRKIQRSSDSGSRSSGSSGSSHYVSHASSSVGGSHTSSSRHF